MRKGTISLSKTTNEDQQKNNIDIHAHCFWISELLDAVESMNLEDW